MASTAVNIYPLTLKGNRLPTLDTVDKATTVLKVLLLLFNLTYAIIVCVLEGTLVNPILQIRKRCLKELGASKRWSQNANAGSRALAPALLTICYSGLPWGRLSTDTGHMRLSKIWPCPKEPW